MSAHKNRKKKIKKKENVIIIINETTTKDELVMWSENFFYSIDGINLHIQFFLLSTFLPYYDQGKKDLSTTTTKMY